MNKTELLNEVQNIFREVFQSTDLMIDSTTTAEDIEQWDSLNHIFLVTAIEKRFNIQFALGELEELKNVGEFISLVEQKI